MALNVLGTTSLCRPETLDALSPLLSGTFMIPRYLWLSSNVLPPSLLNFSNAHKPHAAATAVQIIGSTRGSGGRQSHLVVGMCAHEMINHDIGRMSATCLGRYSNNRQTWNVVASLLQFRS